MSDHLDDLYAERYGQRSWWTTPEKPPEDDEVTCARRRRELDESWHAPAREETA